MFKVGHVSINVGHEHNKLDIHAVLMSKVEHKLDTDITSWTYMQYKWPKLDKRSQMLDSNTITWTQRQYKWPKLDTGSQIALL